MPNMLNILAAMLALAGEPWQMRPQAATLKAMASHGGSATANLVSKSGGGDVTTGEAWERQQWVMQYTDTTWTTIEARTATGMPAYGAQLGSSGLYVVDKEVEADPGDKTIVRATVLYRTLRMTDKMPNHGTGNKWSVVKNISGFPEEGQVDVSRSGQVLVNVLGEQFNPPFTRLTYAAKIQINFLTNSTNIQTEVAATLDHVNNATISMNIAGQSWLFEAGELYFQNYTIQDTNDVNGTRIGAVQFDCLWKPNTTTGAGDAWWDKKPNMSLFKALNPASPAAGMTAILNGSVNNDAIVEPQYLDATGQPLPANSTNLTYVTVIDLTTASFTQLFSGLLT